MVPGAAYFAYIVVRYVALDDFVRGWGSLICSLMIIGGIQLIFIGMVGAVPGPHLRGIQAPAALFLQADA